MEERKRLREEGFVRFKEDIIALKKFFFKRFFRGSPEDLGAKPEVSPPALTTTEHIDPVA
jgi:hypothetical protein